MSIRKRVTKAGVSWAYYFDAPGSNREKREQVTGSGFTTKKKALAAEAQRRIDVAKEQELAQAGVKLETIPTLRELLATFLGGYCVKELAQKTTSRYRDHLRYLSPQLLDMRLDALTPVLFTREWDRLRSEGGHARGSALPRPMEPKTVHNIASFVSSAFRRALERGLAESNPVVASGKPRGKKGRKAVAFSPDQQRAFIANSLHWAVPSILEIAAATGARRGEVLALRWVDIQEGVAVIGRSLSQVKDQVFFKLPKTDESRRVALPVSAIALLAGIQAKQAILREQFGPDYRVDLDLIFCQPNGEPLKPDSISGTVSQIRRRLKLPKGASLHALRHSHGSQLLANGVDIPTVSARLGHSSPATTMKIYAHALEGRDAAAAEVWESAQTAPGQHHKKTASEHADSETTRSTKIERLTTN